MFKKFKAKLKSNKIYAIELGLAGMILASVVTSSILVCVGSIRRQNIVAENGYDEANAKYQAEQLSLLEEQHEAGMISDEKYVDSVANIENLSVDEYMFSDENVPKEAKDAFSSANTLINAAGGLIGGSFVMLGGEVVLSKVALNAQSRVNKTKDYPEEPSRTM